MTTNLNLSLRHPHKKGDRALSQLPDIQQAINEFTAQHDRDQDSISEGGFLICPHYGPWIASLGLSTEDIQELTAYSVLQASKAPNEGVDISLAALLDRAELPPGWREAYSWAFIPPVNTDFLFIMKSALYGEIERRLFQTPPQATQDALALAHLVEAATELESVWINLANAGNYLPMGHVEDWWPQYMSMIDSCLSSSDLAALSETAGSVSETEALSALTPPERLASIYGGWSTVASANPRLPADLVNRELESDWNLLFHPNADRETAWSLIQEILESGDYEELGFCMREFDQMRDGNWFEFSRFAVDSPQATWLKTKILEWCNNNLDDEDERDEALELMGIEIP